MTEFNLNEIKKVHFTGIGGINMSSLAHILLSKGFPVSGSDMKESALTRQLRELGAEIHIGQCAGNITPDIDLLVYTAAIHPDNPELVRAAELGIPTETRAVFLGQLMKWYDEVICISGTHGKTTTTSLISQVMLETDADPTIMAGGILPAIGGNTRIGGFHTLVAEACEYTNSFHSFFPTTEVILNVKADHLDFFKDLDDIRASFRTYTRLLPDDGLLVINGNIEDLPYFTDGLNCRVVTYGLGGDFNFTAKDIVFDAFACGEYDLYKYGEYAGHVKLTITGEHNVENSLAAIACCDSLGIDMDRILAALSHFQGVDRRFQKKGTVGGVTIIDDYAHHPDEINATMSSALRYPHRKLWVVFQPHTYSRTIALMDDFAEALSRADAVVLAEIYAARETNDTGVSSKDLQKKIAERGGECYYFPTFDEIENFLLENCIDGDVLITMGAGDVENIGDALLGN